MRRRPSAARPPGRWPSGTTRARSVVTRPMSRVRRRDPVSRRGSWRRRGRGGRSSARPASWSGSAGGAATPTTAAAARPHFVDETAAAGLDQTYDGDARVRGRRRRRRLRLQRRRQARPVRGRRQQTRPRCTATTARSAARSSSRGCRDPATDLTGVDGAYPIDIDGDGNVDLAVLRCGETRPPARPRRLPLRAGERGVVVRRRQRLRHRLQRDVGGLGRAADARHRPLPQARRLGRSRRSTAPTTSSSGRRRPAPATAARSRSRPATARCRCCSATGTAPAGATCA